MSLCFEAPFEQLRIVAPSLQTVGPCKLLHSDPELLARRPACTGGPYPGRQRRSLCSLDRKLVFKTLGLNAAGRHQPSEFQFMTLTVLRV